MKDSFRYAKLLTMVIVLLCSLALPKAANAGPITFDLTVTNVVGGLFNYDYRVSNTSLFDYSAISIGVVAAPGGVLNLMAPTGFSAFFDPGLGQVDFVENTLNFSAGSSIRGFSFNSPFGPQPSFFTALRLDLVGSPTTSVGTVLAPGSSSVPDSGATLVLLSAGLAGLAAMKNGRRKMAT